MSALSSLSGTTTGPIAAPAPAQPRARGFLHIVRHGVGPGSIYVLTYHRLERSVTYAEPVAPIAPERTNPNRVILSAAKDLSSSAHSANGNGHRADGNGSSASDLQRPTDVTPQNTGVILSVAKDLSSMDGGSSLAPEPDPRPKPILAEGAQALIDLLERIGVDFHRSEVRGALEDILRLGSANIPDLWLSDDDLLAKGLTES